ncbi:MAG: hypothetical protein Q8K72_01660 [Acidimicrobiales bacterium]|nr:hypothetical protein [Acidimicrobiales bacterium]
MLARDGDPGDGRVARLPLSSTGTEVLERLRVVRHRRFAEIFADWPAQDRAALAPRTASVRNSAA